MTPSLIVSSAKVDTTPKDVATHTVTKATIQFRWNCTGPEPVLEQCFDQQDWHHDRLLAVVSVWRPVPVFIGEPGG